MIEEGESLSMISSIFDEISMVLGSIPESRLVEPTDTSSFGKGPRKTRATLIANEEMGDSTSNQGVSSLIRNDSFSEVSRILNAADLSEPLSSKLNVESSADENRRNSEGLLVIDQNDMYTNVFLPLEENNFDHKHLAAVLTEYIRSLNFQLIHVKHFLYVLLINILVRNNRFYQLHQFLQYHVVSDSVPVACQLLSLESIYPPAYQLALDMLKRLCSPGQIVEVLLNRNQLLAALRVIKANKDINIPRSRFLEVAAQQEPIMFYTVFQFFLQRKELGPDCQKYLAQYETLVGSSTGK